MKTTKKISLTPTVVIVTAMAFFLFLVINGSSWAGEENTKQVFVGLFVFIAGCLALTFTITAIKPRKKGKDKFKYSVLPDGEKWRIEK